MRALLLAGLALVAVFCGRLWWDHRQYQRFLVCQEKMRAQIPPGFVAGSILAIEPKECR